MKKKRRPKTRPAGFTLVELMVVIAIIGILAAVVMPRLLRQIGKGQRAAAQVQIKGFEGALDMYFADNYKYPDSLSALVPEYIKKVPNDPWGNPYHYSSTSQHGQDVDLASFGKDGAAGGSDDNEDITNWEEEVK
ncbi:MAG: type II secretion system major pseudopilin GspG [Candidatus Auribacterota bacterium]|nr:type II secretion system major pseudopilin GspG [Candidatus Auribacterota bacterium]